MKFCSAGHSNADESSYCSTCGQSLAQPTGGAGKPGVTAQRSILSSQPQEDDSVGATHGGTPERRRLIVLVTAAIVLLLALGVTAAALLLTSGDDEDEADGDLIRGVAILFDEDGGVEGEWDDCSGSGGYDDFSAGMRLSVKGAEDQIVGSGNVENVTEDNLEDVVQAEFDGDEPIGLDEQEDPGAAQTELRTFLTDIADSGIGCALYFEADVDRSAYYSIELGSRGDLSFSRDELAEQGYVVSMSLGG